jgi:hypothetical protein
MVMQAVVLVMCRFQPSYLSGDMIRQLVSDRPKYFVVLAEMARSGQPDAKGSNDKNHQTAGPWEDHR